MLTFIPGKGLVPRYRFLERLAGRYVPELPISGSLGNRTGIARGREQPDSIDIK